MQSKFAPKSPDITSKGHVGPGVGVTVVSADPGVGDGVDSGLTADSQFPQVKFMRGHLAKMNISNE